MNRALFSAVLALVMLLISGGIVAAAGPQRLPMAACNGGTANAHAVGAQGLESIPHLHDFDLDGIWACYHFNITAPPPGPGYE